MAPKFGTSGLRGLVTELSDALVARHTAAFLATCDHGGRVWLGEDLRPSSPAIAQVIAATASAQGVAVIRAGALPTPALAHAAAQDGAGDGAGAIMVTGSHIPADRNGIKFYTRAGEITKSEEEAISAALETPLGQESAPITEDAEAGARFMARYVTAFGAAAMRFLGQVIDHVGAAIDALLHLGEGQRFTDRRNRRLHHVDKGGVYLVGFRTPRDAKEAVRREIEQSPHY